MNNERTITPEFLEAYGFTRYIHGCEGIFENFPFPFDIDFKKDDYCYIETRWHRQLLCVVLTPLEYTNGEKWFDYEIYIQINVGMDFINLPKGLIELTEHRFSCLFEGLRGEPLRSIKSVV